MGKFIDLTGQKFGKLTVLRGCDDELHPHPTKWLCECDCGNQIVRLGESLRKKRATSCGCERKRFLRELGHERLGKRKKWNHYELTENFYRGFDDKGNSFLISIEDFDLVNKYYWRLSRDNYWIGQYTDNEGHRKNIRLHTIIMEHMYKKIIPNNKVVDHINQNRSDNRRNNLRICSPEENTRNSGLQKNNTSGITGVTFCKDRNKWRVSICHNSKWINLGYFNTKEEAIKIRLKAELKYYGTEFAPQRYLFEQYEIGELNG